MSWYCVTWRLCGLACTQDAGTCIADLLGASKLAEGNSSAGPAACENAVLLTTVLPAAHHTLLAALPSHGQPVLIC